jgi:hypothetical protein
MQQTRMISVIFTEKHVFNMCGGIALNRRDIPEELITKHHLTSRITKRSEESEEEIQFLFRDTTPLLPVWLNTTLSLVLWGNRDKKHSRLPRTGWARKESIEEGKWQYLQPEDIEIPAAFGLEKGVWFQIAEGMKGILVHDEDEHPHVYMLTQPASHYYQTMTRHTRMPVFIGQGI